VRNFRFFWNEDGTSKNYDYKNRPRRQDFAGNLMENGAFYINTVTNILASGNRLSGKIGIYEMPEYTATEIDEPDDWAILENLMRKYVLSKQPRKKIKLFLSDVDGVLTDAGMYYSESGDELKKFNTHDGMGFKLLREAGIKTGIITSEETRIVENRAKKLQVDYLFQNKREGGKLAIAKEICEKEGISLDEVAYIGDDINCFELLSSVGLSACPCDALQKIKAIPNILILERKGGEGAVRELVDLLLNR
jgi:YrbI family 3-deoxy-D-manno-octulosonate 8-phosphate phosphatase